MEYNFLDNSFYTTYEPTKVSTTKINFPLSDESIDISDWALGVLDNGNIIVKNMFNPEENNNQYNPKLIIDNDYEDQNLTSENITPRNNQYKINSNINNRAKRAMDFFISKGLTNFQAAGIVGNLMQESSLDHNIVNKSSGAYGLAQWLGSRKKALFKKYGNNPTFDQQLEFIWEELNTTERNAFLHLLTTKSYEDSTRSIMDKFERPSKKEKDESIAQRLKNARSLLS